MRFFSDKPVLRMQLLVSPDFGEAQSDPVAIERRRGLEMQISRQAFLLEMLCTRC